MTTFGEHAANPRNMKRIENPTGVGRAQVEGDTVHITIAIKASNGIIVEASFESFLCGFAMGMCSLLTERIKGKSLFYAQGISAEDLFSECPGGIPETKRAYAYTAIEALQLALKQSFQAKHP